jgi:hypothetical protein
LLRDAFPRKTIQNVLLYHGAITSAVSHSPYLYRALDSGIFLP